MTHRFTFAAFRRDTTGATIVEFALVAPLFFLMMFVMIEFGLIRFSQVAIESAMTQASRTASIGTNSTGCDRVCTLRALIQQKSQGLIGGDKVTIAAAVVGTGSTSAPDVCLTDPPGSPDTCPAGTPYQDTNNNGMYDGPGNVSLGSAGNIVEIRVSYPWRVQVPMVKYLFGTNGVFLISTTTLIKNEPF